MLEFQPLAEQRQLRGLLEAAELGVAPLRHLIARLVRGEQVHLVVQGPAAAGSVKWAGEVFFGNS